MTDAEYEVQKSRIHSLIEEWVTTLGLRWWKLDFTYRRSYPDTPGTVMHINCDWRYLWATVYIYLPMISDMDDEELEYSFLHELAHIYLDEIARDLDEVGRDHAERVATCIARSWQWVKQKYQPEETSD